MGNDLGAKSPVAVYGGTPQASRPGPSMPLPAERMPRPSPAERPIGCGMSGSCAGIHCGGPQPGEANRRGLGPEPRVGQPDRPEAGRLEPVSLQRRIPRSGPDRTTVPTRSEAGPRLPAGVGDPAAEARTQALDPRRRLERLRDREPPGSPRLAQAGQRQPLEARPPLGEALPAGPLALERLELGDAELGQLLDQPIGTVALGRARGE